MIPDQRCQGSQVSWGELFGPLRLRQHLLEHNVPRHVVSWDLRQKYFVGKVGQCLAQSRDVSHSFEDRRESALASEALNSGAIRYVQESNPA